MLRLINVCKSYKYGKNKNIVLDNINLDFKKSELVFILGKSGSGKSTLLNIIGGLLEIDSGKIMLDDIDISKFDNNMLCNYRNNMIGFIFQDYHLIEYMSALDNVKLGQTIKNNYRDMEILLRRLGIYSKKNVKVNKLSGGEKQRVAIARAMINDPEIILCDEPTGALDSKNSIKVMELLKEISRDKLVIVVSHDKGLANKYADRIINIVDGKVDYIPQVDNVLFREVKKKKISIKSIIKLAIKNLKLKMGRTLFTSLAISLGFICMLLVLCLSKSFNDDINSLEREIVSSFPISVYNGEFLLSSTDINDNDNNNNKINFKKKEDYVHMNKITSSYLDYLKEIDNIREVSYEYNISMPLISDNYKILDNKYFKVLPSNKYLEDNYDVLYGNSINNINEIMLKVDSNNEVLEEILDVFNIDDDINYEDIVGRKIRIIINDDYYVKNGDYYFINSNNMEMYVNSEIELTIVGIVREVEVVNDNSYFYYDSNLIDEILNLNNDSDIVFDQLNIDDNILGIDMEKDDLLSFLGYNTLPSGINIYVNDLHDKKIVLNKLDEYNDNNDKLIYVDTMQDAINILKDIINIVTVVLILFSFISVLVSSLMIFILTNNRVLERIKEIGILRSLGARKKDIVKLFNIENLIISIIASIIGIIVISLLKIPVNSILGILLDGEGMFKIYIDLVIIAVIFNIFIVILSGYIPSIRASKKKITDCIANRF